MPKTKNKIYQHLSGRLGNQLFQWAYGHQLNSYHHSLVVPFHDKSHSIRGYAGNLGSLLKPCAHIGEVRNINSLGFLLKSLDKLRCNHFELAKKIELFLRINRTNHHFEIPIMGKNKPRVVTGFFVNWKSTIGVEEILVSELKESFKHIATPRGLAQEYQVIHVRRGDFLEHKDTYGILHPSYYSQNMIPELETYICTDDKEMAGDIQEFIKAKKIFGPDDLNPIEALKLMANSSSLLMANSTLSWWAGFYCLSMGGRVVIPKPFYKAEELGTLFHPEFTAVPAVFY